MSEHTKEPWRVELKNVPIADTGDYEGVVQIFAGNAKRPLFETYDDSEEAEANARRIVACVNACAGITTEVLEQMPSGPASLLPMYARLEQQRDKLLAALEGVARELGFDWLREEFDTARDVIKGVKGSK